MAVAVLGLHDHSRFEDGVGHEDYVGGALGWVLGVFSHFISLSLSFFFFFRVAFGVRGREGGVLR